MVTAAQPSGKPRMGAGRGEIPKKKPKKPGEPRKRLHRAWLTSATTTGWLIAAPSDPGCKRCGGQARQQRNTRSLGARIPPTRPGPERAAEPSHAIGRAGRNTHAPLRYRTDRCPAPGTIGTVVVSGQTRSE